MHIAIRLGVAWLVSAGLGVGGSAAANLSTAVEHASKSGFEGVVLVTDRDKVLYERAVGTANRETKTPHAATQVWRWASVTKMIAAIIASQLVEENKLALDKPVADYLTRDEFGGEHAARIRIRDLLQHTSGLAKPEVEDAALPPAGASINAHAARTICAAPAKRAPGERMEYNNCDYLVLGAILEKVTGRAFDALVEERIAKPLALTSIGKPEAVRGYLDLKRAEDAGRIPAFGAGGAMTGTPRDLATLDRALLNGKLISPAMREIFWKGEPSLGFIAFGVWAYPAPLKGCKEPVALIERRGAIGGIQVRNVLIPARDRALIVFTNRADVNFGEVWQGSGLTHDLLAAMLCPL
ncbi:MAG: beta-lactamase family protein [Betaproteobacteria bacterium]|nr:beta-lactamase family protein [Betaproteobacteria bacterium]